MEVGSWEWRYKSVPDLILLEIRRISTTTPHSQLPTSHSNKSLYIDRTEQLPQFSIQLPDSFRFIAQPYFSGAAKVTMQGISTAGVMAVESTIMGRPTPKAATGTVNAAPPSVVLGSYFCPSTIT